MLHPSYSELMTKINEEAGEPVVRSRYSIVMGTAKRARKLVDAGYLEFEDHARKPLSIAVDELYSGDIHILTESEEEEMKAAYAARMAEEAERLAKAREAAALQRELAEQAAEAKDDDEDDEEDDDDLPDEEMMAEIDGFLDEASEEITEETEVSEED